MIRRMACSSLLLLSSAAIFAQSSAPAPGITTTAAPEVAEFQKIEDNWAGAVNNRDQYALELILSPLFVDIASTGDVNTRNQQIADVVKEDDKTLRLGQRAITVRLLGDIAVVNGTYTLHHKAANGSPVDEKGIFTHVFQRSHNSWLCINSQRTVLREDGPAAKQKKKSDAEMPFHIPIFSKN